MDPKSMMKMKNLCSQMMNLMEEMSSGAMPEGDDSNESASAPDDDGTDVSMKNMKMKMMAQKSGY